MFVGVYIHKHSWDHEEGNIYISTYTYIHTQRRPSTIFTIDETRTNIALHSIALSCTFFLFFFFFILPHLSTGIR